MSRWTTMYIPDSGHVEIYRFSGGRKELVKVTTSRHEAQQYLCRRVQDEDTVVFLDPHMARGDISHQTGASLKAAAAAQ